MIPVKIPEDIFLEIDKVILKFIKKCKVPPSKYGQFWKM